MWNQNKWFILAVAVFVWLVVVTRYEHVTVPHNHFHSLFDRWTSGVQKMMP